MRGGERGEEVPSRLASLVIFTGPNNLDKFSGALRAPSISLCLMTSTCTAKKLPTVMDRPADVFDILVRRTDEQ